MWRKQTLSRTLAVMRPLAGGIGASGFVFLAFHRLDLAMGGESLGLALVLLALLAGWGLGAEVIGPVRGGSFRSYLVTVLLAALWGFLAMSPLSGAPLHLVLVVAVSACFTGMLWGHRRTGAAPARELFLCGAAVGFGILSFGLAGRIGISGVMLVFGCCAIALAFFVPQSASEPEKRDDAVGGGWKRWSRVALAGACGAYSLALLRTLSLGTGWSGYAATELGAFFCIGLLLRGLLPGGSGRRRGTLMARGLGIVGLTLILGWSFVFYPDLIISEPAAVQSGHSLLQASRMFPLWGMAFCAAFLVPRRRSYSDAGRSFSVAAAVAVGVVLVLSAEGANYWNYLVTGLLAITAVVPMSVSAWRRGGDWKKKTLPVTVLALGTFGFVWILIADQHASWPGLRYAFAWYQRDLRGRFNAPQPPDVQPAGPDGVVVQDRTDQAETFQKRVLSAGETGHFLSGNLAWTSRKQDSAVFPLILEMVAATGGDVRRLAVLEPSIAPLTSSLKSVFPGVSLARIRSVALLRGRLKAGSIDGAILGPGPLTAARCPVSVLNVESLRQLRTGLRKGGIVAIWLPTRSVTEEEMGRALGTVVSVFPDAALLLCNDEIVLLAQAVSPDRGGAEQPGESPDPELSIDYASLRSAFLRDPSRGMLFQSGYLAPSTLVSEFSAGSDAIQRLAGNARPLSVWFPTRPPNLARDLSRTGRPHNLALAALPRVEAREQLVSMLRFSSQNEKEIALPNIRGSYQALTEELLRWAGEAARASQRPGASVDDLIYALRGPRADLSVFAPRAESPDLQLAVALYRFGLFQKALEFLGGSTWPEKDRFDVVYWRGRCLESLGQGRDALAAYSSAIEIDDSSIDALLRMAGIHLKNRRLAPARRHLEKVLEREPENVPALVRLSYICGTQRRYGRATELAWKALQLEPDNTAARDQYYLYRLQARMRGGSGRDGR